MGWRIVATVLALLGLAAPAHAFEEQGIAAPEGPGYVFGSAPLSLLPPDGPAGRIVEPKDRDPRGSGGGAIAYTLGNLNAGVSLLSEPDPGPEGDLALSYSAPLPGSAATQWSFGGGLTWGGSFDSGTLGLGPGLDYGADRGASAGLSLGLSTAIDEGLIFTGRAGAAQSLLEAEDGDALLDPSFFTGFGLGYRF